MDCKTNSITQEYQCDNMIKYITYYKGRLYGTLDEKILVYDLKEKKDSVLQNENGEDITFFVLGGLCIQDDVMYLAANNQIYSIDFNTKQVEVFAGNESKLFGGNKDGPVEDAEFRSPQGLTIRDGVVYVADSENRSIRQIKANVVESFPLRNFGGLRIDPRYVYLAPCSQDVFVCDHDDLWTNIEESNTTIIDLENLPVSQGRLERNGYTLYIANGGNSILKLEHNWKWQRLLWIGNKKEKEDYCLLAKIPAEVVKQIAFYCSEGSKDRMRNC